MNLELIAKLAQQQSRGRSAYEVARESGFRGTVDQWLDSLRGQRGYQGKSAYDVAVENGYVGTPDEWVAYLKGDQGPKGERGPPGPKGDRGPAPDHEWRGTELRFMHPDGEWGRFIDLKGDKGDPGKAGNTAVVGAGPVTLDLNSYMPIGF